MARGGLITCDRVLANEPGQCDACGMGVRRILVSMPSGARKWWAVRREGRNWRVHECPQRPKASAQEVRAAA